MTFKMASLMDTFTDGVCSIIDEHIFTVMAAVE